MQDEQVERIRTGYDVEGEVLRMGALVTKDGPRSDVQIQIPLGMLNRHGLIAGATGTGKTRSLQVLTEQLSDAGVPVFAADMKGDLTGLITPGTASEKLDKRVAGIGQEWEPRGFPVEFWALGGIGHGVPVRATVSTFGPVLLSKVLGLNDTQESTLGLVFHFADRQSWALLDLADLRAVLQYLTSTEGREDLEGIGGVSKATVGVILRKLVTLADQGGDVFFGEPEFDTEDLMRLTDDGRGIISLLELPGVQSRPELFSTFLMWLLADLFERLPEVGDPQKPKLVFFLDEAHLLFKDASKAFLSAIVQTVRLIRSKGIGVFFVTQSPTDIPDDVLAQLGSRVQHQLRAHTPRDAKALKATVSTYPVSDYDDLGEVLQSLGTGEAIVTVMDPDGVPTPVAWTRMRAPEAYMDAVADSEFKPGIAASSMMEKYGESVDRESAYEILQAKLEAGSEEKKAEEAAAETAQPKQRRTSSRGGTKEKSVIEHVTSSSAFKQFARSAGREIVRNLFGTIRRR